MRSLISILFLVFLSVDSFACTCDFGDRTYDEIFEMNYEDSDLIFIGRPVRPTHSDFRLEIIEIFKGKFDEQFINGSGGSSCEEVPTSETWIVYTKISETGLISIFTCTLSRPLDSSLYIKGFVPNYPKDGIEPDKSIRGVKTRNFS